MSIIAMDISKNFAVITSRINLRTAQSRVARILQEHQGTACKGRWKTIHKSRYEKKEKSNIFKALAFQNLTVLIGEGFFLCLVEKRYNLVIREPSLGFLTKFHLKNLSGGTTAPTYEKDRASVKELKEQHSYLIDNITQTFENKEK